MFTGLKNYKRSEQLLFVIVLFISIFGLVGWSTGNLPMAGFSKLYIPIAPSTGVSFLILSLVFLSNYRYKPGRLVHLTGIILILLVFLFSALIVTVYVFRLRLDLENVFLRHPAKMGEILIGRMSPLSALFFILTGTNALVFIKSGEKRPPAFFGILSFFLFLGSSVLLIGYLFRAPLLYGGSFVPVALLSAICFWLLSIALLTTVKLEFWPFTILYGAGYQRRISMAFLPAVLLLLIFNSFVNRWIVSFRNPALGSAIELILSLVVFGTIIIIISRILGEKLNKAYQNLEISEKRFRKAVMHAPFPIMIHAEGEVIMISDSWTQITGYHLADIPTILEWTKKAYGSKAGVSREYIDDLYKLDGSKYNGEWEIITKNGERRIWEFRTSPIGPLPDGRRAVSSMAVDVTDRKDFELQLKEKTEEIETQNEELMSINQELLVARDRAEESDRLKSSFIANMSHEIRTPMNGIMGFSDLLSEPGLDGVKRKQYVSIIHKSSVQLLRVIDNIVEISKLETRQVRAVERKVCINGLLDDIGMVFRFRSEETGITLRLVKQLTDEESTILSDETKINKILSNLVENSFKFTEYGYIEIGCNRVDGQLEIYVKDTGIGISAEKQEVIFNRFSQGDETYSKTHGGLGLGLSIARENSELLGGKITLLSEKNKGAVFTLSIPYKPADS